MGELKGQPEFQNETLELLVIPKIAQQLTFEKG